MKHKELKTDNSSLKRKIADVSGVPSDVLLGVPLLSVVGKQEITVTNYRGIQEYTDTLIRIQTKIGQIRLVGKHLSIEYYTNDEMKINGCIHQIEYQKQEGLV